MRNVSPGQFYVTIHDIHLAGFCCTSSCPEKTFPRDDERSKSREAMRGNTRIGPVLEVKVTEHLDRYGIEIKIDSMKKDKTQSWIVISSSVLKRIRNLSTMKKRHQAQGDPSR